MSITLKIGKKSAEITVEGALNFENVKEISSNADKAVAAEVKSIVIDVSGATGIDSAGISGLLNLRAGLLDRGMDLSIKSATAEISSTLRLLKIHDLLNLKKGSVSS